MKDAGLEKNQSNSSMLKTALIEESLDRITGSHLIGGCGVQLLKNAAENYPAWLEAIAGARERIFFESYIIHDDAQGAKFADALTERARNGVEVKLIYDWMGGFGKTSGKFWRDLRGGGVDARCYNPPKLSDPLAILSRDHRKSLTVDGSVAFVSGLCVGQDWVGRPQKGIPAWRDTGVRLTGAAVANVEQAFADIWAEIGAPLDVSKLSRRADFQTAGNTALRVVDSVPSSSYIYRLDQFLAAGVKKEIWLTDAYFVGVPSYLQSLKDAAGGGVDVRILVPRSTDIAIIRDTTRSTYRPLLEAGVRVFEWNGSMIHAKTAVFDGRYSRIGSTNLNVASWFGNYELDVLIEDEDFGAEMRQMFLDDLTHSTEIVLADQRQVKLRTSDENASGENGRRKTTGGGSVRKATAGAIGAATSISSAITQKTALGAAESRLLFLVGGALLALALAFVIFPRLASVPLILILLLLAFPTLAKALKNYRNF